MYAKTRTMVIARHRYKDHDLIVRCYTYDFGIKSYLLKGILKSKKGKLRPAFFQLFSMLELEVNQKEGRSLNYIREVKRYYNPVSIYEDINKSTILMFLAEVLSQILKEEEGNKELYNFLEATIQWFDQQEGHANFHLIFLTELTRYLGFYPTILKEHRYFDLSEGISKPHESGIYSVSGENLNILKSVLGIKFDSELKLNVPTVQKREFLNMMLLYFRLHLDGFKEPKSLAVLNEVFSDS